MGRIGKRCIKLRVAVLHRQRQNDGLCACKAHAGVGDGDAVLYRMAFKREDAHLMPVGTQQFGQIGLPHIAADDRECRRFVHGKTSFAPVYAAVCRSDNVPS